MMHDMIDLSEEHAFLCEVPGWNNKSYLQLVDVCRQAQPYHPHVTQHLSLPASSAQHFSLEDRMSSLVVSKKGGNSMDFDI